MNKMRSLLLTAGVIMLILISCSKLDEESYSFFTPDQFYKSANDASAGLTAIYGSLAGLYSSVGWQVPDYTADQMFPRAVVGRDQLANFNYDPNYGLINTYWNTCYTGIGSANTLLANIDEVQMDATLKSRYKAEACFLRGLFYFDLAKSFGDVPLRIKPALTVDDTEVPVSPVNAVYAQVLSDLDFAEQNLPTTPPEKGRPCKAAAIALAAKVRLYNEDWAGAAAKAKQLISDPGTFGLVANVKDLWDVTKEDADRIENIFAVEYSRLPGLTASDFSAFFSPSAPFMRTAYRSQFAYPSFYASFDNNDQRKKLMDTTYVNSAGQIIDQNNPALKGRVAIFKYIDPQSNGALGENNYPIIRFADVLLIHAESEARVNGPNAAAYESINKVRRRAFGLPVNAPSPYDLVPGLSQTNFVSAVLQERSWELCFEADRWYDMTRTQTFMNVSKCTSLEYPVRVVQAKHRWFPLPAIEVQTNSRLQQNPLWR